MAKYRARVPVWQGNPDLIHKAFLYDEGSKRGGGVYLWKNIEAAKKAHGPAFQEAIQSSLWSQAGVSVLRSAHRDRQQRQAGVRRGGVVGPSQDEAALVGGLVTRLLILLAL
jgi:hypothetical protein